jgi:hypothetical protein
LEKHCGVFELVMQRNGPKNAIKKSKQNNDRKKKFPSFFVQKVFDMAFPNFQKVFVVF